MKIFAIYDSKAEAYLTPIFAPTKGVALRMFATAANDPTTDFSKYAGDYTLMEIGTWDPTKGDIEKNQTKTNLGTALEHQTEEQAEPNIERIA